MDDAPRVGSLARVADPPLFPNTPLVTAWESLERTGGLLLPVIDAHGEYQGVVRWSDLLHLAPPVSSVPPVGSGGEPPPGDRPGLSAALEGRTIGEVMVRFPTVDARASIWDAKQLMDDSGIGCLPVVDGRRLVGYVQSTDLFRAMLRRDWPSD